jgi:hypothetical protein
MNNFNEYVNHLVGNSSTPLLGFLSWYNVPGAAELDYVVFNDLAEQHGAPLRKMGAPKAPDVFRRGCNAAKRTKVHGIDDTFLNYTMRDAGCDAGFVFRNLVEERVDANNHTLGYREIAQAVFSRASENVTSTIHINSDDYAYGYATTMIGDVERFMTTRRNLMPAIQTREAVRQALEHTLSGVRVRPSGGIYFVSLDHAPELQALLSVYNDLPMCSLHILPLVDDLKQREMLQEAFESESVDETTALMAEIAELVAGGNKIPAKKFLGIQQRYAEQVDKMQQYATLLEAGLDKSRTMLDLANDQIIQLLTMTS